MSNRTDGQMLFVYTIFAFLSKLILINSQHTNLLHPSSTYTTFDFVTPLEYKSTSDPRVQFSGLAMSTCKRERKPDSFHTRRWSHSPLFIFPSYHVDDTDGIFTAICRRGG